MFGLGIGELLLILAVVLLLFGGKKLPQLGAGLGQSIRGFKKALEGGEDDKDKPAGPPASPRTACAACCRWGRRPASPPLSTPPSPP